MTATTNDQFIDLGDRTLRVRRLAPQRTDGLERTTLVFLHEGLGCIEMWRDFPQRLCDVLQCKGVVYDRTAYGQSSPSLRCGARRRTRRMRSPRSIDWSEAIPRV